MAGNLNAGGLLLVLLITAVLLVRLGHWPGSFTRVDTGGLAGGGLFFLTACLTTVLYHEAKPIHQQLLPSICLTLVLIFTAPGRIRSLAVAAISLSAIVWSFHYLSLLGPDAAYTGSPYWANRSAHASSRSNLKAIQKALTLVAAAGDQSYPAGAVSGSEVGRLLPRDYTRHTQSRSVETYRFWHSWLTGLYGKTYHPLALWYPGGPLKEGSKRLEFRRR